jgi:predicted DNA-binding protein with PD1-like motif
MRRGLSLGAAVGLAVFLLPAYAADGVGTPPRVFGTAQIQDVYRVVLDRDAMLLESIVDVIKQKGVQDGQVMVTAGSVQECTYHFVSSTAAKPKDVFKTVKGPFEILGGGGIIASGVPHIHMTFSSRGAAFGGHLENGCKILYLGEVTILKYSGPALDRKPNENGIMMLQSK